MKHEFSAGGVVFRRKTTQKNAKAIEVLVCQHSLHHGWVFPKGLIGDTDKKESKEETALREVKEETGVDGKIIKQLSPQTYWYVWEGEKIKKTVYYFIMEYIGGDITQHDYEMENVEWLPLDKVEDRLTYSSDKKVWREAREILLTL